MKHATDISYSQRPGVQPVLINLKMNDPFGFHIQLNKKEYSAYPEEHDVVLYDGLYAKIKMIDQIQDKKSGKSVTVVELNYDQDDDGHSEGQDESMDHMDDVNNFSPKTL